MGFPVLETVHILIFYQKSRVSFSFPPDYSQVIIIRKINHINPTTERLQDSL